MNTLRVAPRQSRTDAARGEFERLGAQALRDLGLCRSDFLSYRVDPGSKRVVARRRTPFDDLQPRRG